MAQVDRPNGYWRGMCSLAEKVSNGDVTQFGGDPKSVNDLADLLQGMGHGSLAGKLRAVTKGKDQGILLALELQPDGEVKYGWDDKQSN